MLNGCVALWPAAAASWIYQRVPAHFLTARIIPHCVTCGNASRMLMLHPLSGLFLHIIRIESSLFPSFVQTHLSHTHTHTETEKTLATAALMTSFV